ncbi:MAG: FeoA family protein [Bacillota bacterium]|nr:FeoA family protein [Bacillota bacterium]
MRTLADVEIGERTTVRRLHGTDTAKRRLLSMGLTKGAAVELRKLAPLGDPLELTVRGYELSLRRADAACVEVE